MAPDAVRKPEGPCDPTAAPARRCSRQAWDDTLLERSNLRAPVAFVLIPASTAAAGRQRRRAPARARKEGCAVL